MGNTSIYLPAGSETTVDINVDNAVYTMDVFDLDQMFLDAANKAKDMNTEWAKEFPALFKKASGLTINTGQSILLLNAKNDLLAKLKKSLFLASENLNGQASPSKQKTKKKSRSS